MDGRETNSAHQTLQTGNQAMLKLRKGFTLIELLIVVVIIGILAAIAIPKFANTKSKAYITAMKSDLRNLVTAEEAFFSDSSKYTATLTQLKYQNSTGVNAPAIVVGAGYWTATVDHTQLPGQSCGLGINTTNPLSGVVAAEGEPACK
jgi:prepilin-type N-terminal cleavage/methylation domain-containing protein